MHWPLRGFTKPTLSLTFAPPLASMQHRCMQAGEAIASPNFMKAKLISFNNQKYAESSNELMIFGITFSFFTV